MDGIRRNYENGRIDDLLDRPRVIWMMVGILELKAIAYGSPNIDVQPEEEQFGCFTVCKS